jgi:hypothetical protein
MYSYSTDAGIDTEYTLSGLSPGLTYYIAVTCYDTDGNESWYSNQIVVTPQPEPMISTFLDEIDFGTVVIGDSSEMMLTVSNTGTAELNVTDIISSDTQFAPSMTSFDVPVSGSQDVPVSYIPSTYGEASASLLISSDAYNTPELSISLTGFGDLSPNPEILSIVDVSDDQGGQVRVSFERSKYDGLDSTQQIVTYTVWRNIEEDEWDAVGLFNAVQDSIYNYVAPTLCDSTGEGICWTTFKVSAHTTNPDIFYYSDALSGYSIDNIAPGVPGGLSALASAEGITLTWLPNSEEDFQYYGIYRSTNPDFEPDAMDSYTYATADTSFTDSVVTIDITYYYRISAFDYSGNESGYSAQVGDIYLAADDVSLVPVQFALHHNHPNPFNPITNLRYDLPEQAQVTLTVYDLLGRKVTQLVNTTQDAGYRSVQWNATDMHGKPVSAGVYLYQIQAGGFMETKKMVLLK